VAVPPTVTSGRDDARARARRAVTPPATTSPQAPANKEPIPFGYRTYRWVNLAVLPVFLVSMLGLAFAWSLVFHYLAEAHAKNFPPAVVLIKPGLYGLLFGVPGIFMGIFCSVAVTELFTRLLLGRRYTEYCHWEQARRGLHGQAGVKSFGRKFVVFACLLGFAMAAWVPLAMNWYARFNENEIALKPLWSFGETVYLYTDLDRIVRTTHVDVKGDIIPRENLHLRFKDGRTWETGETFFVPNLPEERKRLLDLLQGKSGKSIVVAKFVEHVPGW
jgi:hypothetical protein